MERKLPREKPLMYRWRFPRGSVMNPTRIAAVVAAVACTLGSPAAFAAHKTHHLSPKAYAYKLTRQRGWTSQWWALNEIVTDESHWDPCAVNPRRHLCSYTGRWSCGIPQAQPCPWRDLWASRYKQVRWLMKYINRRYGDPLHALSFRRVHHWY